MAQLEPEAIGVYQAAPRWLGPSVAPDRARVYLRALWLAWTSERAAEPTRMRVHPALHAEVARALLANERLTERPPEDQPTWLRFKSAWLVPDDTLACWADVVFEQ